MSKHVSIKKLYLAFTSCTGVSIDSRSVQKGDMFFALKGPNFDGHKYIEAAFRIGASISVIDDERYISENTFFVENVETALQNLASYHRLQLKIPIIGLTGSNGKTTTKELMKSVLSQKMKTFATSGNLNNHLGVPLSLLAINQEHEVAIIEMGANHPGEIKMLSEIAMPDIGLITNIGKAHLEGFIDLEGVRKAKTELYDYLRSVNGQLFINFSDPYLKDSVSAEMNFIPYNINSARMITAFPHLKLEYKDHSIQTLLSGSYNLINALAAIVVGEYFKIPLNDIVNGLQNYVPENNRSQIKETLHNKLILDAYNANPSSMRASIGNIASSEAQNKVLLVGHMLELGKSSEREHQDLVEFIKKWEWKQVLLIGSEFSICNTDFPIYDNVKSLIKEIDKYDIRGCTILLKGSRGITLEKLVPFL